MNGSSNKDPTAARANRALVAGIGNIFMGDDGFGCEVIKRLAHHDLPAHVDVVDFGIRGMDLGYALMEGYARAIFVDTIERGGAPGSVYVIAPQVEASEVESGQDLLTPHGMDPARVLRFIATLGDRRPQVWLVACEPEYLGGENGHMGLSDAVQAALDPAVAEVVEVINRPGPATPTSSAALRQQTKTEKRPAGAHTPGGMS